jgi:hypothetical protein
MEMACIGPNCPATRGTPCVSAAIITVLFLRGVGIVGHTQGDQAAAAQGTEADAEKSNNLGHRRSTSTSVAACSIFEPCLSFDMLMNSFTCFPFIPLHYALMRFYLCET